MKLLKNFIPKETCDSIINYAEDFGTWHSDENYMFVYQHMKKKNFPIIGKIIGNRNIASHILLKYNVGAKHNLHIDGLDPLWKTIHYVTLNENFTGGELVFPLANKVFNNDNVGDLIVYRANNQHYQNYITTVEGGVRYSLVFKYYKR
jgi:hypothetical protein